ncbi:GUN4 domain-containing protein [Chroococcidiopsis sp. TS-821]|uniref:GUN4 domain-containing protein n=1 Tax=Chroococcidiopsis sp. TS-821 TaxID=1378066 RepID=UPI000CEE47E3|nr:GUN4 domain-containing protein [Chroococcidiopsis sp. TS-821]PPS41443.1 hypothetical protein B1A85_16935 [Chroococcidiopsis sp. TS-821]
MTDPTTAFDTNFDVSALALQLTTGSEKVQAQTIEKLAILGTAGEELLMKFLLQRQSHPPTWIDGKAYQVLYNAESPAAKEFLQTNFPTGIVQLNSEQGIDYTPLQKLLADQDFQAADRLTLQKLCELAGPAAIQRKWLYFTEVENFTNTDLQTINKLWLIHSEGKFGFSVQREIWLGVGKNWEKLWPKIGWKSGNNWTRYPNEFTWNLSAPRGHLPLSNQLRGVRVMASLLAHPAWER